MSIPAASTSFASALPKPTRAAWVLGAAGLLPFLAGALASWWAEGGWQVFAATALLGYSAVILSFLGGIHWGLVMLGGQSRTFQLLWGVTPSLLGWTALLLNSAWGLVLSAISLIVCYVVDCQLYRPAGLGAWLGLRAVLTAVAVVSCLAGAAAFLA